jgi:hypothetical protein
VSYLPPIFQQDNQYSARVTRRLLDVIGTEGVVGATEFEVTERSAGAAMAVDVSPGRAFIEGDDQPNQGTYLVAVEVAVEVPVPAADLTDPRVDLLVAEVRDSNAGGPAGDDWQFRVVEGTPDPSPVAPALPDSAIALAEIAVGANVTSILDVNITDVRTFAEAPLAPLPPLPALNDLTDVNALSPSSWDILRFNSTSGVWESADGANVQNLNASNLASGTVPSARVSGSYTGITGTGALNAGSVTSGFGNVNIGTSTFTGNGSGLTTLNATNVSSGTLASARLPAGTILQVVVANKTDTFTNNTDAYVDITGLSVTLTPRSTSSRLYISFFTNANNQGDNGGAAILLTNGSNVALLQGNAAGSRLQATTGVAGVTLSNIRFNNFNNAGSTVISPNTTSAYTVKLRVRRAGGSQPAVINRPGEDSDTIERIRTASSLVVMEIA